MGKRKKGFQQFTRFCPSIIAVLQSLGGSGTTSEVIDRAIEILGIPESEQEKELKSGGSRVRNQAAWARLYLVKGGLLESSKRGVWSLTDQGQKTDPKNFDFEKLFKTVQRDHHAGMKNEKENTAIDEEEITIAADENYRSQLLNFIKNLSPAGFERLCQRLLRESGFQRVTVTGKSGDGGIDGIGILQVNHFVSFNVLFQCKRYQGSVTPSNVRDFRGAMMGRADKGIIITTGTFTVEAIKEARRDGVPPIELVAGDDLIRLFEKLELGLIPRTTYYYSDTLIFNKIASTMALF
nr:restriction endonuclease [Planctomycetota bacterium]